jgi:nitrogen fixation protein NifX
MLKVAFSSRDTFHVDQHFGAGDRILIYEIDEKYAKLSAVGEFVPVQRKGVNKDRFRSNDTPDKATIGLDYGDARILYLDALSPDDKVLAKLDLIKDCVAVFAVSIGRSSVKRLVEGGIQPVMVENGSEIAAILYEIAGNIKTGGVSWIDLALHDKDPSRFADMLKED